MTLRHCVVLFCQNLIMVLHCVVNKVKFSYTAIKELSLSGQTIFWFNFLLFYHTFHFGQTRLWTLPQVTHTFLCQWLFSTTLSAWHFWYWIMSCSALYLHLHFGVCVLPGQLDCNISGGWYWSYTLQNIKQLHT